MKTNKLKNYDLDKASPEKAVTTLTELFKEFDLNDNNTVIFNSCIDKLIESIKSSEKELKENQKKLTKVEKLMNKYKKAHFRSLSTDDIQRLAEKAIENG